MNRGTHRALRLSASLLAVSLAHPAWAQASPEAPAGPPAAAAPANAIGDIVVTARRRSESLQNVPVAITALSTATLERNGIVSVEQLGTVAPSVNISSQDRGDDNFYIRGQSPGVIGGGLRNFTSVATYFAEVPTPIAGSGQIYDMASVQILKGPQGTLFGRNTTGGAVLFEPARPNQDLGGYLKVSFGNYAYHDVEGVLNVPVIHDVLAVRVAFDTARREGFTTSVITGQKLDSRNNDSFRVSALLTPLPGLENLTIVDSNLRNNTGSGLVLTAVDPRAELSPPSAALPLPILAASPSAAYIGCLSAQLPGCAPGGAAAAFGAAAAYGGFGLTGLTPQDFENALAAQNALGPRKVLEPLLLFRRVRDIGVTNKTTYQLSDTITLKNIFSFRKEQTAEISNLTAGLEYLYSAYPNGGVPYVRGFAQFTDEFQIQGKLPSLGLNYIVGYYHEQATPGMNESYRSDAFGAITDTQQYYNDKSDAVFAHAEYNIAPKLQFSGGLRYTWDHRFASSSVTLDDGTCNQTNPATNALECPAAGHADFHALTGDATLQYKLTSRALLYAAFRHGYKSGGFNLPAPTADTVQFAPESVNDVEVGLKVDWDIGVPLRTDIAVFHDNYENIQISLPFTINNNIVSVVQNAASAINKGVEVESTLVPFKGFNLSGYGSYLSALCQVNAGAACRIGHQIAFQPRWKFGAGASYRLPLPQTDITLSADYSYTGRVNTSDPDAATVGLPDSYPGYGVLNLHVQWNDSLAKGIDIALFMTNATNKTYVIGGYPTSFELGIDTSLYGEPRMFGGSVKFHFGAHGGS